MTFAKRVVEVDLFDRPLSSSLIVEAFFAPINFASLL